MKFKNYTTRLVLFLFITTYFLLVSCQNSHTTDRFLSEAENLIQTAPDSAYSLLIKMDTSIDFNRAQRAEWNLLITQAMDKAYMEHTTDSLIRKATTYYEQQKNPSRLMLSYYYMGRVYQELGDSPRAQEYYLKALDVGKDANDLLLLARIENNLGSLYTLQGSYEAALPHLKIATHYFEILNDSVFLSYNFRDIARAYVQMDSLDRAIEFYQKAIPYVNEESAASIFNELGSTYVENKKFDQAYYYLGKAITASLHLRTYYPACLSIGKYFVAINDTDSARYYLNQSLQSPRIETQAGSYFHLAQLAHKNYNWEKYAIYNKKFEKLQNEITEKTHEQTIQRMQRLYDYTIVRDEAEMYQLRHTIAQKNNLLLTVSSLFLLTLLILFFFRLRNQKSTWNKELEQLLNQLHAREKRVKDNLRRIQELEQLQIIAEEREKAALLAEKEFLENINKTIELERTAKQEQDEVFYKTAIYQHFHNPNLGCIQEKDKKELFETIENIYSGFKDRINKQIPKLKDYELEICYYIKARITQADISRILDIDTSTIGMRQKRMRNKMGNSQKISNTDFIRWIESL